MRQRVQMLFLLGILTCMLGMSGCMERTIKTNNVEPCYAEAYKVYQSGDYSAALEKFKVALTMDRNKEYSVYGYTYLGHCFKELGEMDAAKRYYESALSTGEEPIMCYANLGVYYREIDENELAEQQYLSALELDEDCPEILSGLASLYYFTDRLEEALLLLEKAVSQKDAPDSCDSNLVFVYASLGRIEDAKERLEIVREKGYSDEDCELMLAHIMECEQKQVAGTLPKTDETTKPVPTETPKPTATPKPIATPKPTETPEPIATPVPTEGAEQQLSKIVAIDPGHQSKANYDKEPVGPGADELKTKVSSGTQGTFTKYPEHQFNLELALQLRDALQETGYEVVLTRETEEVNLSNVERAQLANEAEADIFIRIHADGSDNEAANGISVLYPSENNPYIPEFSADSKRLAQNVLDGMCEETGAKKRGIVKRDDLSGTNWAQMPVILIEAGFMTNEAEEKKLLDADYQARLVQGMVAGIEEYFKE